MCVASRARPRRPRRAHAQLHAALAGWLAGAILCATPAAARAEEAPPEPLYLAPVVDGVAKPGVVIVLSEPDGVLVAPASLRAIGILPDAGQDRPGGKRFFPITGDTSVSIDMATQVIRFKVPASELLAAVTTVSAPIITTPAKSGTGAFLNYNMSLIPPVAGHAPWQAAGTLTGVLFSPYGFLSSSELLQAPQQKADDQPLLTRLNTTYELDQPGIPRAWRAGDVVTEPPGWARAEFLGGMQIATDYQLQPNRETFPTPIIGQTLAQPSDVTLLVNNVAAYQSNTDAGPFALVGIPVINGLNEITVQTRTSSGQVTSQSVPFYASGTMLSLGLVAYNVTLGFIRHHYGQTNNLYSTPALDATYNIGLRRYLTSTFHVETAPNLELVGVGFETAGVWGDLAGAFAESGHERTSFEPAQLGRLYSVQYQRSTPAFGIAAGIVSATSGYNDLGLETDAAYPAVNWHVSISATLPGHAGNIALAYTVQSARRHNRDAFLLGTYSVQLSRRWSATISCFHGFVRAFGVGSGDDGCDAGVNMTLGGGTAGGTAEFGSGQRPEWGESYGYFPSSAIGFGGSAGNDMGDYTSRSLRLEDVSSLAALTTDIAQTGNTRSVEFGLAGSLIAMDGFYASRPVNNAFAVVDFGYPKVPVFLSNQPVGDTDGAGRMLIPSLVPDYANQISVDPTSLPLSASFSSDEVSVTPPSEGGVTVKFPVSRLDAVLLNVALRKGGRPPAGSLFYIQGAQTPIVIGYDGYLYIQNPPPQLVGTVIMSTGNCSISTKIVVSVRNAMVGMPVTCAN